MPIPTEVSTFEKFGHELENISREYHGRDYILCATYVSPGVKVDAGGFIIVGGRVIHVPGWTPDNAEFAKAKLALGSAALAMASLMPAGPERTEVETSIFKEFGMARQVTHTTA